MNLSGRLDCVPWRGVLTVIGAFLCNLSLGTLYTFGNMSPYISSYMTAKLGQRIDVADITWVYGAAVMAQGSLMIPGGMIERRFGPRAAILGCIMMSSGVTLTYFTVDVAQYAVVLTYGTLFGLGTSLAYIAFLAGAMKWFPNRQGLVGGIVVSGFGLGPLIFNPIQTHFLNPKNYPPDRNGIFTQKEVLDKVPSLFLLLGCVYSSLQLISCLIASKAPNNAQQDQHCLQQIEKPSPSESSSLTEPKPVEGDNSMANSLTPFEFLRTRELYLLWLTFLLNNTVSFYFHSMYKAYGQTFIRDDHFLAMTGAVAAVFNCLGRIFWGVLGDRTSYKVLMRYVCIGSLVILLSLPSCSLSGKYAYAVWSCGFHLFTSGSFAIIPLCVSKNFGAEHAGSNYGIVFSNTVVGGIMAAALTQQLSAALSFTSVIFTLCSLPVCSFLLTIPFREKSK